MPFPWGQPTTYQVNARCSHCDQELEQRGSTVIECSCEEAEQERLLSREKQRQRQKARKPSFAEARQRNKRPIRGS